MPKGAVCRERHGLYTHLVGMNSWSCGGLLGRGLLGCCAAQDGPIDVRPQVFAAHRSAGGALDGWAVLCRNLALSGPPLAQKHGGKPKPLRKARSWLDR